MSLADFLFRPLPRIWALPAPYWLRTLGPILPALLVLLALISPASGITPDSQQYLLAAENLRATGTLGTDFLSWPPLYPTLLSLSEDGPMLAGLIGYVGAFLTIVGVWAIGRRLVTGPLLAVGLLALVCLPHFAWVFGHVWSETVYVPLTVWAAFFWTRFLEGKRGVVAACTLLALAMLTRHVGVVVAAAMGLSLLASRLPWRSTTVGVAAIVIACLPYVVWIGRTFALSGTIAGPRPASLHPSLTYHMELYGRVWGHWIAPHFYPMWGIAIGAALLATVLVTGYIGRRVKAILFCALFVLGHSALTIYTASRTILDVDPRTLFPVYWALMLLALWLINRETSKFGGYVLAAYAIFWFSAPNTVVNAVVG